MESRKAIRKRLVKQKRSLFIQKSIGVTTVLASTSGVFTTLVNAPEANATGVNETEVAKSTSPANTQDHLWGMGDVRNAARAHVH